MQLILKLILRYSLRRTINYFALSAVILSITLLFTVNAVMKGFDDELQKLFRGSLSDILIEWPWKSESLSTVTKKLEGWDWSPALEGFGMIRTDRSVSLMTFKGIQPEREKKLRQKMLIKAIDLDNLVHTGESKTLGAFSSMLSPFSSGLAPAPALVGHLLAKDLQLVEGDEFTLVVPNYLDQIGNKRFMVKGFIKTGIYEDDQGKVFINIKDANELLQHPAGFSYLQVADQRPDSIRRLRELLPKASVQSWEEKHSVRLRAVTHERKLIALIMSMIVIVCGFSILAIQWSFVQEKTSDIGILRALGFSGRQIFMVFLGVSWAVGLSGLLLGLGAGVLVSSNANAIVQFFHLDIFPSDIYYQDDLPVKIEWSDMAWISMLSLTVTTCAGLLPAWRSLSVEPIKAISHQ